MKEKSKNDFVELCRGERVTKRDLMLWAYEGDYSGVDSAIPMNHPVYSNGESWHFAADCTMGCRVVDLLDLIPDSIVEKLRQMQHIRNEMTPMEKLSEVEWRERYEEYESIRNELFTREE